MKAEVKRTCLYHLPGIPKINSNCASCEVDYDRTHYPCNYDCSDFFPFPQVTYEEVREELEKRGIRITSRIEELLKKEIGIVDTVIASKRITVSPKKVVEDIIPHIRSLST